MINQFTTYLFLSVAFLSCTVKHPGTTTNYEYIDSRLIAEQYLDSLKNQGVDTFLIFRESCSGCIGKTNTYYIFWNADNATYVKKVDIYSNYSQVVRTGDIFFPFIKNEDKIRNQVLTEPKIDLMHYGYIELNLQICDNSFEYHLSEYYRFEENYEKEVVRWVMLIESKLFRIEASPFYWN